MRHQLGAITERNPVISFRGGISRTTIARRFSKKPGSVEWRLKKTALKRKKRTQPIDHEGGADPAKSLRNADFAFHCAMRRAIAQGLEHPPMIGVFKDARPLSAPRLFEPVPHSSGCTSPALECAELELRVD